MLKSRYYQSFWLVLAVLFSSISTTANSQSTISGSGLAAFPQGGPDLVRFVAIAASENPVGVVRLLQDAETKAPAVQQAVGAGLAQAYRILIDAENRDAAGAIVAALCDTRASLSAFGFAAAMGRSLREICTPAWSFDRGARSSLFSIKALGGIASPN